VCGLEGFERTATLKPVTFPAGAREVGDEAALHRIADKGDITRSSGALNHRASTRRPCVVTTTRWDRPTSRIAWPTCQLSSSGAISLAV